MKSLFGRRNFEIEMRELPDRPLGSGMVRIKPLYCGVCGTDLHFLRHKDEFTPLGHEVSAEVVELGPDVQHIRLGQRVILEDISLCGCCEACKSGDPDHCRSPRTMDGQPGMSTLLTAHESMLNPYEGIDDCTASMTEPLAVALRGVEALKLRPFESVAIFGMGAIGLYSAACARLSGAGRIAMFARSPGSQRNRAAEAAAADLGADEFYYSADPDYIRRAMDKGAFDAAIVAAPPSTCTEAMRLLGYGGRVLAMGVSFGSDTHASLDINDMVFNKKQLITSIAEPALLFPRSIRMIRSGRIDAARIVTHTLDMAAASELRLLYDQDAPAIKTVIKCN